MSFGPIMQFKVGELQIELAPLTKEVMGEFVQPGLQQQSITRYLGMTTAPVLEDEHEWFEATRKAYDKLVWGIWVIEKEGSRLLIGNSSLFEIQRHHIHQATSGSMIFRKEYWGRGIASAAHKARTWYAFQHMGLHRIKSAVLRGNGGSSKALSRSGYSFVYTERNEKFVDGSLRHLDCFECINPLDPFWQQWWHGDRPTRSNIEARDKTREALNWAAQHVTLL